MNPILWIALLQPTWAASLSVSQDGSGDHTAIQAAINASTSGDEIVVHSGEWSVNLDFQNKSLTLLGNNSPILRAEEEMFPVVTLSSADNNQSRIEGFQFEGSNGVALLIWDAEVELSDLTITGFGDFQGGALVQSGGHVVGESLTLTGGVGLQGGLVYIQNGVLELENSTLVNSNADDGGAIYADAASLLLTNTSFQTNTASNFGGAIRLMANSDVAVIGGSFSENLALNGGAIYAATTALQLDSVEIIENTALEYGGGVYIENGFTLSDQGSTWKANWSEERGGCIYANSEDGGESQPGVLNFQDSVFQECRSNDANGGAISAYRWVTIQAQDVSFIENYSNSGGGAVYLYDANAASVFSGCTFEENRARWYRGGAIHAYTDNDLTFENTIFNRNMADKEGGAISTHRRSPLTLQNVDFIKNTSERRVGGAIWVSQVNRDEYDVTIEQCEFTENTSDLGGGALAIIDGGLVQLEEVSFTDNRVESVGPGGGLFLFQNGAVRVSHTEFVGNNATYGGGVYNETTRVDIESEVDLIAEDHWSNNVFLDNRATLGGAFGSLDNSYLVMTNNTFLRNHATETGSILHLADAAPSVRNNAFAFSPYGSAVHLVDETTQALADFQYNAWHGNADGDSTEDWGLVSSTGSVSADPLFISSHTDLGSQEYTAQITLDSPLRDAGDPSIEDTDGTVSDIGYAGGPGFESGDGDLDGYPSSYDCNDQDDTVFPGAEETWYDSINQDCSTGSDFDADNDGFDHLDHGGEDCDDANPDVFEGCPEPLEDTGVEDDDPVDPTKTTSSKGCGGCNHPNGQPWGLLSALASLLWIRRRATPELACTPARTPQGRHLRARAVPHREPRW